MRGVKGPVQRTHRAAGIGVTLRAMPVALALVAAAWVAHFPAIDSEFILDDEAYITNNPNLTDAAGLVRIWTRPEQNPQYYPLTFTLIWLQHRIWQIYPGGYHLVSICLHAVNTLLVWRVLRRLAVPGSALAALLFAIHPVGVAAVAWAAEQKTLLATAFALATVLAWLGFIARPRAGRLLVVIFLYAAALAAKTGVVALPLVLGLLTWWRAPDRCRRLLPALVPMIALGSVASLVTAARESLFLEGTPIVGTPLHRVVLAGQAAWVYVAHLLWPVGLTVFYPRWPVRPDSPPAWTGTLAAVVVAGILWRLRNRIGRGPLVAAASYGLMLAPSLGLVDFALLNATWVADHLQYSAMPAIFGLFAAATCPIWKHPRARPLGVTAAIVGLATLVLATRWRAETYGDRQTLFTDNLRRNPSAWLARANLGVALIREGKASAALPHLREATRLRPELTGPRMSYALALELVGREQEAMAEYARVIEAGTHLSPMARQRLAHCAVRLAQKAAAEGDLAAARDMYERAIRAEPRRADLVYALARLELPANRKRAVTLLERAAILAPDRWEYQHDLALALGESGRFQDALPHAREAVRLAPDHAPPHYLLGRLLELTGHPGEAIRQYREALRADPRFVPAHRALAAATARAAMGDRAP